jgi:hypothetical protein
MNTLLMISVIHTRKTINIDLSPVSQTLALFKFKNLVCTQANMNGEPVSALSKFRQASKLTSFLSGCKQRAHIFHI